MDTNISKSFPVQQIIKQKENEKRKKSAAGGSNCYTVYEEQQHANGEFHNSYEKVRRYFEFFQNFTRMSSFTFYTFDHIVEALKTAFPKNTSELEVVSKNGNLLLGSEFIQIRVSDIELG